MPMKTTEAWILDFVGMCVETNGLIPVKVSMTETHHDGAGKGHRIKFIHVFAMAGISSVARFVIAMDGVEDIYMRIVDRNGSAVYPMEGQGSGGSDWLKFQFGYPAHLRALLATWRSTCALGQAPEPNRALDTAGIRLPEEIENAK